MKFFNRDYVTLDKLTSQELENILSYIAEKDEFIFGIAGNKFIQVDVRYSRFAERMFFKLTIPKSWVEPTGLDTAIDMIKRGVL